MAKRHRHTEMRALPRVFAPRQIDGDTGEDDQDADARCCRCEPREIDNEQAGDQHVNERHDRITPRSIRSFRRRHFLSQDDDSANHQHVEDQIDRNDVLEQLRVNIAVGDRTSRRILNNGARQGEKRGPNSLRRKRNRGSVMFVRRGCATEESASRAIA